ncbi:MAG: BON domain-containing protein [Armatimonadota bacterium]|jgi:osmotically-inducible protein OsmY
MVRPISGYIRLWLPIVALAALMTSSGNIAYAQSCPIGGYTITACPVISDAVIRDKIASRLSGSVASTRYPVRVSVCEGVVTLTGTVQTIGQRDMATVLASSVPGVISISNQLTVDPSLADDLFLMGEVRRAFNKSYIDSKQVRVAVSEGVVQLTGNVTTEVDREQATQIAASVPGVAAVYNNLTVRGPAGSPF